MAQKENHRSTMMFPAGRVDTIQVLSGPSPAIRQAESVCLQAQRHIHSWGLLVGAGKSAQLPPTPACLSAPLFQSSSGTGRHTAYTRKARTKAQNSMYVLSCPFWENPPSPAPPGPGMGKPKW